MKSKENVLVTAIVSHGDHHADKRSQTEKLVFSCSRRNTKFKDRTIRLARAGVGREWLPQTAGVFGMREMLYN